MISTEFARRVVRTLSAQFLVNLCFVFFLINLHWQLQTIRQEQKEEVVGCVRKMLSLYAKINKAWSMDFLD